jgi:DNA polymerase-3 subunit gamma/tau
MPSLSQEYRPQSFGTVTGQTAITETLRKELATGRLGHAYLFSGPRGVGKTTTARIFAKALNCIDLQNGEPCAKCPACLAFQAGTAVDVIELDAATHTGVDTVRESIIEHARFAPMLAKRKVYILDEAHMLSTASWNALLKTLEEPPAHAFFILATTEVHKVPATIVSRCQRFEFRRIEDQALAARLREIATSQQWQVDDGVIQLVVSRAEGCLRDAETLLGQLGALGESHLTLELAHLVIPESRLPQAAELMTTWANKQHAEGLACIQRLFEQGVPLLPLMDDLLVIVKKLLMASADPGLAVTWQEGMPDEKLLAPLVSRFSPLELNDLALVLMERRRDMKAGIDPLFALQLVSTVTACRDERRGVTTTVSASPSVPPVVKESKVAASVTMSSPAPVAPVTPSVVPEPAKPVSVEPIEPAPAPVSSEPQVVKSQVPAQIDIQVVRAKWNATIRAVEEKNHSLPFILKISRPEYVEGETVYIRFQYAFHRDKIIADLKNRRLVEEALREILQLPTVKVEGLVGEDQVAGETRSQDVVSNVLKAFGGNVVE